VAKKTEVAKKFNMEAALLGTISRIYGFLRLEANGGGRLARWEAVEKWLTEQERKQREEAHESTDGSPRIQTG